MPVCKALFRILQMSWPLRQRARVKPSEESFLRRRYAETSERTVNPPIAGTRHLAET